MIRPAPSRKPGACCRHPAMLRLLLRNGYRLRAVEHFGDPARERIHFIKPLSWNA